MDITPVDAKKSLSYIRQLIYNPSETKYMKIFEEFQNDAPKNVLEYFLINWHDIRSQWTVYSMTNKNFNNLTNNRLEIQNGKIKLIVEKNSKLTHFFKRFDIYIKNKTDEKNMRVADIFYKTINSKFLVDSAEFKYEEYLTPFAAKYVLEEIELSNCTTILKNNQDNSFDILFADEVINTTSIECKCYKFTSMGLPCKHIFAVKRALSMDMFDKSLCLMRWTREYYRLKNRCLFEDNQNLNLSETEVMEASFQINAIEINSVIQSLQSEILSKPNEIDKRVPTILEIIKLWKENKEFNIHVTNNMKNNCESKFILI